MIVSDEEVQTLGNSVHRHYLARRELDLRARGQGLFKIRSQRSESLSIAVSVMSSAGRQCGATNVTRKRSAHAVHRLSCATVRCRVRSDLHSLSRKRSFRSVKAISRAAKFR